jgi:NACalpha-BTF3-like transcription factor
MSESLMQQLNHDNHEEEVRVTLEKEEDLHFWMEKFSVSANELRDALYASGTNIAVVVEQYIKDHRQATPGE